MRQLAPASLRPFVFAACLALPGTAMAVEEDPIPPKPTKTTTECADGMVWDEAAKACTQPKESRLDDDTLYRAAREFAYAGAYGHALNALDAMSDQGADRVLTYRGYTLRKLGETGKALGFYREALARNPDNLLARSYLGQAFVEMGRHDLARAELTEIRARGGRMTWPEIALREALRSGRAAGY